MSPLRSPEQAIEVDQVYIGAQSGREPAAEAGRRGGIRCTADPAKADKRTRSKWSRVMRYAAAYKRDSEPLDQLVQRKGAINACAVRFTRWLGRGRATRLRASLTCTA
jgi:alkanesulfonate monooxygenase SsuD/methylene tetrahydromethanopterin reductase-like flavin-dependent oxidoreductase (luciferase family)